MCKEYRVYGKDCVNVRLFVYKYKMNNDKISFVEIISEIFIKEYLFIYLLLVNILWKMKNINYLDLYLFKILKIDLIRKYINVFIFLREKIVF